MDVEQCVYNNHRKATVLYCTVLVILHNKHFTFMYNIKLNLQPMIPPKRFDIFPPDREMLRRSRCVLIFLKKKGALLHTAGTI